MRRNVVVIIVCTFLLLLTACGGENNEPQDVHAQPPYDNQELQNAYQRLQSENQALQLEIQTLISEIEQLLTENHDLQVNMDRWLTENNYLQAELNSEEKMFEVTATGAITATVRHTMSDHVFDEQHRIVILTQFQGLPFMLRLDPQIVAQLEIEETYVFEIEDTPLGAMTLFEYQRLAWGSPIGIGIFFDRQLNIRSIRIAEEHELGLNSYNMTLRRDGHSP
ncbi:MAG: hypothetical protein FWC71_11065 [Defluviitaleaceae bacterium]|nr:hypothetical protein [Defluviitaleaceae bacterium]